MCLFSKAFSSHLYPLKTSLNCTTITRNNSAHTLLIEAYLIRSYRPIKHAHVLKLDILKEIYDSIAFAS